MRIITIDCRYVTSEVDFWAAYVRLAEPEGAEYFGRNLDAFWDGLTGGPGWPGECALKFVNTESLRSFRDGRFLDALREIAKQSTIVRITVE